MQTFLPYPDFYHSAKVLDYRRLGKQRLEAKQLIEVILDLPTRNGKPRKGWINHPATRMWRGHVNALKHYYNIILAEWIKRGYNNTMLPCVVESIEYPSWLGNDEFHSSHRSNLLRKDLEYYGQFGWIESNDLPYVWPI